MRDLMLALGRLASLAAGVALGLAGAMTWAGEKNSPHLGRPASAPDIAAWQLNVYPDGTGLPAGRGAAKQGAPLYAQHCASCHGDQGIGGTAEELAGGHAPLTSAVPDKNIGTYWPYATTLFDFTRRSMPMDAPGSLNADEIYAITAYLLFRNGIIGERDEMDAHTLPQVQMPNRNGFLWIDAKDQPAASP
jgi:cytochrome c